LFRGQIFFLFLIINISLFSQGIKSINEINQAFKVLSVSDSNKLNPLKFSVQIGEFNKVIDSENPISKYPLLYFKEKNSYKYFVGNYYNYSSARMMSKMLIKEGLDKAFIICFGTLTDTLISLVNTNESEDTLKTGLIQNKEIKALDNEDKDFSLNSNSESNTNPKQIKIDNEINQGFKVFPVTDSSELANPKFSVQIGVFKKLISLENPISKYPSFYLKTKNNYKYFVGKYENLLSAKKMKQLLVLDGFSDAFIICFGAQKENIINDSNAIKVEENNILKQSDTLDLSLETEQETDVNIEKLDSIENDQLEEIEGDVLEQSDTLDLSLETEQETDVNIENLVSIENDQLEEIEGDVLEQSDTLDLSLETEQETGLNIENKGSIKDDQLEGTDDGSKDTLSVVRNIIVKKISLDSLRKLDSIKIINEKIQKFINLTNPSDPEQFMENITYLDPTLRTSGVSDSTQFKEVFYTIQLGAYSKPLRPPNYIFKFDLFMSEHNSLFKYCNGQFKTLNEARKQRDEYHLTGLYDAFIIAYGKPNKDSYLYDEEMRNLDKKLDSLNQIRLEELKNITIIELDYRVPNIYYIELEVYKSKLVAQIESLKSTLPDLDVNTRKRFMGYQHYTKKFNSLLNAKKTLNRIYENGIKNARIIKSTEAEYKNNYEYRVQIGSINSKNSNIIKSDEFAYLRIVKSYFKSKNYYFTISRDELAESESDEKFCKENNLKTSKIIVFQNGIQTTMEKANSEYKY
jgi:hypothetical protein